MGKARSGAAKAQAGTEVVRILEGITDGFCTLDRQWRFTYANAAAARLLHEPRERFLKRSLWEVFPAAAGSSFQVECRRALAEGTTVAFDTYYPPCDVWFEVRAYPAPEGLSVLFQDITARKRREQSLREGEAREQLLAEVQRRAAELDAVIENTDAHLAVLDRDLRFVMVNTAYATGSGHSKAELIGRNHFELFPNAENQAIFERVRDMGEPYRAVEKPFEYADQPWRGVTYWNWILVPVRNPAGQVERLLFSLTDVTQQVRARHQVERLAEEAGQRAQQLDTTIAAIADGLTIYDAEGRIVRTNPAADAVLQYSADESQAPIAERLARLDPRMPDGSPFPAGQLPLSCALRGETVRSVPFIVWRGGRTIWLSASAAPLYAPDGSLMGAVTTFTDITALHELQEQREDLLRAVSHDLRSPLTAVQGQAQLLLRRLQRAGLTGPEQRSAEAIITGAQRMNAMIQDLVDSARLEAGQLHLSLAAVDLGTFIPHLLERLAAALEVGRIRLEAPAGLAAVSADAAHLERILVNLLSNALKYSAPGSEVTISLAPAVGAVITAVSDRGPGIAPEELPHLFQRYARLGRGREAQGSLGLGLYITRTLVEAHRGQLWVESEVGVGSTFYFSLPLAT